MEGGRSNAVVLFLSTCALILFFCGNELEDADYRAWWTERYQSLRSCLGGREEERRGEERRGEVRRRRGG